MQKILSKIFGKIMITGGWLLLIITTILIKFASTQPLWIEENFSTNIYPVVSKVQRSIFGWIPFSVGDIFYGFLVIVVIFKTVQLIRTIYFKKFNRQFLLTGLKQLIFFFLFVYVFFYGLWGLNYNRQGIADKMGLEIRGNNVADIDTITGLIQQRMNALAASINIKSRDTFNRKKILFEKATEAYLYAGNKFPFLNYSPQSIKPSVYSYLGNYLGFQGYYNPFSGEGQVNTTIPRVIEPFVTTHEIAHQLGYAKENEANFVAFLACRTIPSDIFRYSMYFDMYNYSINELFSLDSNLAKKYNEKLHPQVQKDIKEYKAFYKKHKNPVESVIMWLYSNYLQANNQPDGKRTYNKVVSFLVAYYKKYGADAL